MTRNETINHMKKLINKLNQHRDEYYNQNGSSIPDVFYDRMFDELAELEQGTGIILSGSPTQTVGYIPVSNLKKVRHPIPLLSLDKTKQVRDIRDFIRKGEGQSLLMLKMDGLTVELDYENGHLQEASTRGNGDIGEIITHNIPAFLNVPLQIPYLGKLVVTGEAHIQTDDFEKVRASSIDHDGRPYKTPRNLASGSVRTLDPSVCKGRCVRFTPFNVLEGLDEDPAVSDSKSAKLKELVEFGFALCDFISIDSNLDEREIESLIEVLQKIAEAKKVPIDGIVAVYDSISYSRSCGKTGHHYKDGMAFKFEDEIVETVLSTIEWTPTRSGEIAPVAVFDTVDLDGCNVSRASLSNLTTIKELELNPGCRILVCKRNMIIPHVEDNLDRGHYHDSYPATCPSCGALLRFVPGLAIKAG